jgi:hypothetical protein
MLKTSSEDIDSAPVSGVTGPGIQMVSDKTTALSLDNTVAKLSFGRGSVLHLPSPEMVFSFLLIFCWSFRLLLRA